MSAVHRLADVGVLVELADLDSVLALAASVRTRRARGDTVFADIIDVVPAAKTLLLTVAAARSAVLTKLEHQMRQMAATVAPDAAPGADAEDCVRIPVRYDGQDLPDVAAILGLSVPGVVQRHTGLTWRAAFGGFAPGFFYLLPLHDGFGRPIPRRGEPRTQVPAGALALAGEFGAVYPRSSPGGWQLIGTALATMWDVDRDPPALLSPGALVRFVDVAAG